MANNQSSSNFTGNGIVVAALAVSGAMYLYHNPPLHGARPEMTETQLHETASAQTIEARLWQAFSASMGATRKPIPAHAPTTAMTWRGEG